MYQLYQVGIEFWIRFFSDWNGNRETIELSVFGRVRLPARPGDLRREKSSPMACGAFRPSSMFS